MTQKIEGRGVFLVHSDKGYEIVTSRVVDSLATPDAFLLRVRDEAIGDSEPVEKGEDTVIDDYVAESDGTCQKKAVEGACAA